MPDEQNQQQEQNFETLFSELIYNITMATWSRKSDALDKVLKSPEFDLVLHNWLGCEEVLFFFYNPTTKVLEHFHQALKSGLTLPGKKLAHRENNTGIDLPPFVEKIEKESESDELFGDDPGPEDFESTPLLLIKNLRSEKPRRSKSEEAHDMIVVRRGENATFSFEYSILKYLSEKKIQTIGEAVQNIQMDPGRVGIECWQRVFGEIIDIESPLQIHNEDRESSRWFLARMVDWLRDVLKLGESKKSEYKYLERNEVDQNWFIRDADNLRELLNDQRNLIPKKILGDITESIILNCVAEENFEQKVSIETTEFKSRTRIKPRLHFQQDSKNLVALILDVPNDDKDDEELQSVPFLLGKFHERTIIEENYQKIRTILSSIAVRDIFKYTIQRQSLQAEKLTNTKSLFEVINQVGWIHEIKSPIGKIQAYSNNISDEKLKQDFIGWSRKAIDNIDQIRHLNSSIGTKPRLFIFFRCFSEVWKTVKAKLLNDFINKGDLSIEEIFSSSAGSVWINKPALSLILENIIANALEAMDQAKVENPKLIIRLEYSDSRWAKIMIQNNGALIPKKTVKHLFDNPVKSSKSDGQGIGLYLCNYLAQLNDGRIKYEDKDGLATFIIKYPLRSYSE